MSELDALQAEQEVVIDYTNWRGEGALRRVWPFTIFHGSTKYHPTQQWLLNAFDTEKNELRTFAMSKIHSWGTPHALG